MIVNDEDRLDHGALYYNFLKVTYSFSFLSTQERTRITGFNGLSVITEEGIAALNRVPFIYIVKFAQSE